MTTHTLSTLRRDLEGLDAQIKEYELALYDAVVLYEDEEEQKRISEILHDLNVQRIRFSHAYSIQVGQINGT